MKRALEASVPLSQHIENHRNTLASKKNQIPQLRARIEHLERQRKAPGERRHLRHNAAVDVEMGRLEDLITRLEDDVDMKEFERAIVPYMDAYVKHSGVQRCRDRYMVPGESSMHADDSSKQTQSDVVAEYINVVQGGVPHIAIDRHDMCPQCINTEMVLVPSRAIVACPECGRCATFLDATSSSIAYDESIEMVCSKRLRILLDHDDHLQFAATCLMTGGILVQARQPLCGNGTGFHLYEHPRIRCSPHPIQ